MEQMNLSIREPNSKFNFKEVSMTITHLDDPNERKIRRAIF